MEPILNRGLLADSPCLEFGLENQALPFDVIHAPGVESVLHTYFTPTPKMAGFPGIAHGGVVYTMLHYLSTCVSTLLGPTRSLLREWKLGVLRPCRHVSG